MESFFGRMKEELDVSVFETRAQASQQVFKYIQTYYNRIRRHSGIDDLPPNDFEKRRAASFTCPFLSGALMVWCPLSTPLLVHIGFVADYLQVAHSAAGRVVFLIESITENLDKTAVGTRCVRPAHRFFVHALNLLSTFGLLKLIERLSL